MSFENLSTESTRNLLLLQKPLLDKLNLKIYNELKASTYKSCEQMVNILLDPKNYYIEQLKDLYKQCLGRLELDQIEPMEYRSKLCLIKVMILKLENKPTESLQMIHYALLYHPYDELINSLIIFINHSQFHSTLRAALINDIKYNSLNLVNFNVPTISMNLTFLKQTDRLRMLKKYEKAIVKRMSEKDPLQAAMSYIDLNMAVTGDPTSYASNLILACLYLYKAMTLPNKHLSEIYAYRSILFDISVQLFLLTRHYLPLYAQMYLYKILYTLILRSNELFKHRFSDDKSNISNRRPKNELIINDYQETLIEEIAKSIVQISKVTPFTHLPTATAYDLVYMNYAGNEFLATYLKQMSCRSSMYQYYFFEGIWKGWIRNEDFDEERFQSINAFLNDRNFNIADVEDLLNWSLLPRTVDGWLWSGKHRLQLREPAYSKVVGITLNNDTGDIEFLFTQASNNEHNLFDMHDVVDILTNGITSAFFTLDPPDNNYHSHPFNEMKYLPKRLSLATNYLQTLLHADYLLKMISTNTEVCSQNPFEMRPSDSGFMLRLPSHIRNEFKSIIEQKHQNLIGDNIHRFWIQAGTVSFQQTFHRGFFGFGRINENIQKFYIADDLKMSVRKHRMKYDEKGNLIDDTNDIENDHSAEAQFTKLFTKYYDEIGEYFPELLRLKELLKLGALSLFIQAQYERMKDYIHTIQSDTSIDEHLKKIKARIGRYPTGYDKTDEEVVSTLLNKLSSEFFCKKSELRPYVIDYLTYRDCQHELTGFIKKSLIEHKTKLKRTIDKMKIYILSNESPENDAKGLGNDPSRCAWVPAIFSNSEINYVRVYGGVNNTLDVHQVDNISLPKSIKTVKAEKSFEKVNKVRQQEQQFNRNQSQKISASANNSGSRTRPENNQATSGGSGDKNRNNNNQREREKPPKKESSVNQFARLVKTGGAPKQIDRIDAGNPDRGEKPHVHFKGGGALNKDGTWKHKPSDGSENKIFT
ncbi:unnamed protein product, partial [Rotaria sp. Silwood2]